MYNSLRFALITCTKLAKPLTAKTLQPCAILFWLESKIAPRICTRIFLHTCTMSRHKDINCISRCKQSRITVTRVQKIIIAISRCSQSALLIQIYTMGQKSDLEQKESRADNDEKLIAVIPGVGVLCAFLPCSRLLSFCQQQLCSAAGAFCAHPHPSVPCSALRILHFARFKNIYAYTLLMRSLLHLFMCVMHSFIFRA